jgi:hypothetical protein
MTQPPEDSGVQDLQPLTFALIKDDGRAGRLPGPDRGQERAGHRVLAYGDHRLSEVVVGNALKGRRDSVVLATKFSRPAGDDPNQQGASRRWIMTAVENSLRRLQWGATTERSRSCPSSSVTDVTVRPPREVSTDFGMMRRASGGG